VSKDAKEVLSQKEDKDEEMLRNSDYSGAGGCTCRRLCRRSIACNYPHPIACTYSKAGTDANAYADTGTDASAYADTGTYASTYA